MLRTERQYQDYIVKLMNKSYKIQYNDDREEITDGYFIYKGYLYTNIKNVLIAKGKKLTELDSESLERIRAKELQAIKCNYQYSLKQGEIVRDIYTLEYENKKHYVALNEKYAKLLGDCSIDANYQSDIYLRAIQSVTAYGEFLIMPMKLEQSEVLQQLPIRETL